MKRLSVILLSSALLSGCVSMPKTTQPAAGSFQSKPVAERQAQLNAIQSWNATGAISIQQAQQSPVIMRFEWQQLGASNYRVDLAASLNLAAVSITGQPHRVTLQKGNEPPMSAATPEQLMQKNLGWSLPIPSLWYWARGLPAPGAAPVTKYDDFGHLILLQQDGWQVKFSGYRPVQGVDLPQVLELRRADLFVKVAIKDWRVIK